VGLEKISEVFRSLLWDYAKQNGISPIQIQLMIFIAYHKEELRTVSYLAKEFNVTKPTISDSIKTLEKKGFIKKKYSKIDSRSFQSSLTKAGIELVKETEKFTSPIENQMELIETKELEIIFSSLNKLIFNLNKIGIISVQRMCFGCTFYSNEDDLNFCNLLDKKLNESELRIDCPEYKEK
jgi:DNA-binding MarR family transcriptional regulator